MSHEYFEDFVDIWQEIKILQIRAEKRIEYYWGLFLNFCTLLSILIGCSLFWGLIHYFKPGVLLGFLCSIPGMLLGCTPFVYQYFRNNNQSKLYFYITKHMRENLNHIHREDIFIINEKQKNTIFYALHLLKKYCNTRIIQDIEFKEKVIQEHYEKKHYLSILKEIDYIYQNYYSHFSSKIRKEIEKQRRLNIKNRFRALVYSEKEINGGTINI